MGGRQSTPGSGGEEEEPQLSYWQMMRLGYAELVNAIIRPPRAEYDPSHLGPSTFEFCEKRFRRVDFELTNERRQRLVCSQWEPVEYPEDGRLPCLIYLHGNSSARVEALPQLSLCLSLGITLVGIDFAGSGLSEGEFVSLGYFEKEDLKVLITHLRSTGRVSSVALWGRSMGAATAIMHGERDPSIAAMVLDSSFADLQQLADEMVEKGREQGLNVPRFVTRLTLRMIKSSVQARAGFPISALSPITHAPRCYIPALFVAGRNDDFISPRHSQQLSEAYGGDKNIIIVEGDHNSIRPKFMYDSVANFLIITLQLKDAWLLPGCHKYVGLPPWVKLGEGNLFMDELDEDDAVAEYWADYVFGEGLHSPERLARELGVVGSLDLLEGEEAGGATEDQQQKGPMPVPDPHLPHQSRSMPPLPPGQTHHHQEMNIGMTQARQREVQAALYHAMGRRGPNGSGSLSSRGLDHGSGSGSNLSMHAGSNHSLHAIEVPGSHEAPPPHLRQPSLTQNLSVGSAPSRGSSLSAMDGPMTARRAQQIIQSVPESWVCAACTLINSRLMAFCEACGTEPPPVRTPRDYSVTSHAHPANADRPLSTSSSSSSSRPSTRGRHSHSSSSQARRPSSASSGSGAERAQSGDDQGHRSEPSGRNSRASSTSSRGSSGSRGSG